MKKSVAFICLFIFSICLFSGCAKKQGLERYVTELRSDIFYGQTEQLKVKAFYGFKETPFLNDGKTGEKEYFLKFRLLDKETDLTTYTLYFLHDGTEYTKQFSVDPVTHALSAEIPVENFNKKSFDLKVKYSENSVDVNMQSIIPKGTISYVTALEKVKNSQKELIKAFTDEQGNFNAEIYARVLVKDDKAYWYIGFAYGKDRLKALLVDGKTGEVVAIREVF